MLSYGNARTALFIFSEWVDHEFKRVFKRASERYTASSFNRGVILDEIYFVNTQLEHFLTRPESWFLEATGSSKERTIAIHEEYLRSLEDSHEQYYSEECYYKLMCDVYAEIVKCRVTAMKLYTSLGGGGEVLMLR